MTALPRIFDDIAQHAASLDCWQQHYDQLTPGRFQGSLQDLALPGLRLFRERMSSGVAQHTRAPAGTANVLMPLRMPAADPQTTAARAIQPDGFTLLPHEREFFFCTPPGADYAVLSLRLELLERLLLPEDLDRFMHRPRGYGMPCRPALLMTLRYKVLRMLELVAGDAGTDAAAEQALLRDEVLCLLLDHIESAQGGRPRLRELGGGQHHYVVRYCHERVLASEAPIGMLELCRELRLPRRTLHHAFERATGLAPGRYLRAVRLNAAARGLRADPAARVTDAALRWGFSHASHFGLEFRKLFGRTPTVAA